LALWLLENGAELNPRASVREDDAGRGDWGVEDAILTINPYVSHEEPRELALKIKQPRCRIRYMISTKVSSWIHIYIYTYMYENINNILEVNHHLKNGGSF